MQRNFHHCNIFTMKSIVLFILSLMIFCACSPKAEQDRERATNDTASGAQNVNTDTVAEIQLVNFRFEAMQKLMDRQIIAERPVLSGDTLLVAFRMNVTQSDKYYCEPHFKNDTLILKISPGNTQYDCAGSVRFTATIGACNKMPGHMAVEYNFSRHIIL